MFKIGDRVMQTDSVSVIQRFRLHTGTVVGLRNGRVIVQFDDIDNPDGHAGWSTQEEFLEPVTSYDGDDNKRICDFIEEF